MTWKVRQCNFTPSTVGISGTQCHHVSALDVVKGIGEYKEWGSLHQPVKLFHTNTRLCMFLAQPRAGIVAMKNIRCESMKWFWSISIFVWFVEISLIFSGFEMCGLDWIIGIEFSRRDNSTWGWFETLFLILQLFYLFNLYTSSSP
jgi:hypothetical protein